MTNNSKRLFRALIVIISVLLVLTCVIGGISMWENRIENQFPVWEKLSDTNDRGFAANHEVEMRFTGIDFDVEAPNGKRQDRVIVDVKIDSPDGASPDPGHIAVDYLYKDEWYTVFYYNTGALSAPWIRGDFHDIMYFYVPCGLFAKDGMYRMTVYGLGYCDIDIIGIEDA